MCPPALDTGKVLPASGFALICKAFRSHIKVSHQMVAFMSILRWPRGPKGVCFQKSSHGPIQEHSLRFRGIKRIQFVHGSFGLANSIDIKSSNLNLSTTSLSLLLHSMNRCFNIREHGSRITVEVHRYIDTATPRAEQPQGSKPKFMNLNLNSDIQKRKFKAHVIPQAAKQELPPPFRTRKTKKTP